MSTATVLTCNPTRMDLLGYAGEKHPPMRFAELPLDVQFLLLCAREAAKKAQTWIRPERWPRGAAVLTVSGKIRSGHRIETSFIHPVTGSYGIHSSIDALNSIKVSLGGERIVVAAFVGRETVPGLTQMDLDMLAEHGAQMLYGSDAEFRGDVQRCSIHYRESA